MAALPRHSSSNSSKTLVLQVAAAYYALDERSSSASPSPSGASWNNNTTYCSTQSQLACNAAPAESGSPSETDSNSSSSAFSRITRLSVSSSSSSSFYSSSFLSESTSMSSSSFSALPAEESPPPPAAEYSLTCRPTQQLQAECGGRAVATAVISGGASEGDGGSAAAAASNQRRRAFLEYSILNGDMVQIPPSGGDAGIENCGAAAAAATGFSTPPSFLPTSPGCPDDHCSSSSSSSYHSCSDGSDPFPIFHPRYTAPTPQNHRFFRTSSRPPSSTAAIATELLSSYLESHASYGRAIKSPFSVTPRAAAAAPAPPWGKSKGTPSSGVAPAPLRSRQSSGGIPHGGTWFRDSVHPKIIKGIHPTRRAAASVSSLPPSPPPAQGGKVHVPLLLIPKSLYATVDNNVVISQTHSAVTNKASSVLRSRTHLQQQSCPSSLSADSGSGAGGGAQLTSASNYTPSPSSSREIWDWTKSTTTRAKSGIMRTLEVAFTGTTAAATGTTTRRSVSLPKTRPPPPPTAAETVDDKLQGLEMSWKTKQFPAVERFFASPMRPRNHLSNKLQNSKQPAAAASSHGIHHKYGEAPLAPIGGRSRGGVDEKMSPSVELPSTCTDASAHIKRQLEEDQSVVTVVRSLSPPLLGQHRRRNSHSDSSPSKKALLLPVSKFSPPVIVVGGPTPPRRNAAANCKADSDSSSGGNIIQARVDFVMHKEEDNGMPSVRMRVTGGLEEEEEAVMMVANGCMVVDTEEAADNRHSIASGRNSAGTSSVDDEYYKPQQLQYVLHSNSDLSRWSYNGSSMGRGEGSRAPASTSAWRRSWLNSSRSRPASPLLNKLQQKQLVVGVMRVGAENSTRNSSGSAGDCRGSGRDDQNLKSSNSSSSRSTSSSTDSSSADHEHQYSGNAAEFVLYEQQQEYSTSAAAALAELEPANEQRSRSLRFSPQAIIRRSIFPSPLASPAAAASASPYHRRKQLLSPFMSSDHALRCGNYKRIIGRANNYHNIDVVDASTSSNISTSDEEDGEDDPLQLQVENFGPATIAAAARGTFNRLNWKELAAIIVHPAAATSDPLLAASSSCSPCGVPAADSSKGGSITECNGGGGVTVLLPMGDHGLPNRRRSSPPCLIERWRWGGCSECGGWDLGCGMKVLVGGGEGASATDNSRAAAEWTIYSQGSKPELVFSLCFLGGGSYELCFGRRQLSPGVAFATAVAIVHCHQLLPPPPTTNKLVPC